MLRAQPIDEWHYIDRTSVLHTRHVEGLHGAGVIQSDRLFAMLYLGMPNDNGVVSVVLPTTDPADELSSILVSPNGQRFERILRADEMDIARATAGSIAYSFPITPEDVELFKSAQSWRLRAGEASWTLTLSGSRRAISEAERRYTLDLERIETSAGVPVTHDAAD